MQHLRKTPVAVTSKWFYVQFVQFEALKYCALILQVVPDQFSRGESRKPEVQGGGSEGYPEGCVPALVQRLSLPGAERSDPAAQGTALGGSGQGIFCFFRVTGGQHWRETQIAREVWTMEVIWSLSAWPKLDQVVYYTCS